MIFFADTEGSITKVIQEPVYQGSHNAGRVVFVAPFPNSMVTVGFVLPNGVRTAVNLATPNMVQTDLTDIITPSGQKYNAWTYLLERSITEYAGKVAVQFFVTTGNNNQLLASYTSELTIQKGVPVVLPEEPTSTLYTQILQYLTRIETKLTNIIIPVPALPTENIDFNAIYLLDNNGYYNFYIYYTTIEAWVQIDKSVVTIENGNEIKDSTKIYLLTRSNTHYTEGVYVLANNEPLRLLSVNDLGINGKITLAVEGWNEKTYEFLIASLNENDAIFFSPVTKVDKNLIEDANIFVTAEGSTVIFSAQKTPSFAINLNTFIVRGKP